MRLGFHCEMKRAALGTIVMTAILMLPCSAPTQDLEPHAYSPSPAGVSFLVFGFGRSSGGVVLDPTIPVTNVQATLYTPVVGVGHTFGLFGRETLVTGSLPYAWGKVTGAVGNEQGEITRSGLADLNLKFSINLHGCPAQTPREFAAARHKAMIVASSVTIDAPSGQYSSTKLINLGTNRWAFKPELGVSFPVKRFDFDGYVATWFFGANERSYPGTSTRTEDSLRSVQAHVSYTLRRAMWVALDSTWYGGGGAHTNGGPAVAPQNSSRLGATMSLPLSKRQSAKLSYSSGLVERAGTAFTTIALSWQYTWMH